MCKVCYQYLNITFLNNQCNIHVIPCQVETKIVASTDLLKDMYSLLTIGKLSVLSIFKYFLSKYSIQYPCPCQVETNILVWADVLKDIYSLLTIGKLNVLSIFNYFISK